MDQDAKKWLAEIKYAAQMIIGVHESIERATEEMEILPDRGNYVLARQSAIKIWKEELKIHEHNLIEGYKQYQELKSN